MTFMMILTSQCVPHAPGNIVRDMLGAEFGSTHRVTREQRALVDHLRKDAADGPDVDRCRVVLGPQQDFRRTVPQRHHLRTHPFFVMLHIVTEYYILMLLRCKQ